MRTATNVGAEQLKKRGLEGHTVRKMSKLSVARVKRDFSWEVKTGKDGSTRWGGGGDRKKDRQDLTVA